MKIQFTFTTLLVASVVYANPVSAERLWKLPLNVNDVNTKVHFSVSTTWHTVHGKTGNLSGRIWLVNPDLPMSVHANIHVPVNKFATGNRFRDRRLREIMASDSYPDVILSIVSIGSKCTPLKIRKDNSCISIMRGTLTIRGLTREIRLPYVITEIDSGFKVSGEISFEWKKFDVKDPSIFIAKVNKLVTVSYSIVLPFKESE